MTQLRKINPKTWKSKESWVREHLSEQGYLPFKETESGMLPEGVKPERYYSLSTFVRDHIGEQGWNSSEQVKSMDSYARALTTYMSVHKGLEDLIKPEEEGKADSVKRHESSFINLYSLYAGAVAGLTTLGSELLDEGSYTLTVDFSHSKKNLVYNSTKTLVDALAKGQIQTGEMGDQEFNQILQGFYSFLINQIEFEKDRYADVMDRYRLTDASWNLDGSHWELDDIVLSGFTFTPAVKGELEVEEVEYADIIGNDDLLEFLIRLEDTLLHYNPATKDNRALNIAKMPTRIMMKGRPGTGKTLTAMAFITSLSRKAEEYGIPFELLKLDSGVKSKWFGESEERIREVFTQVRQGKKLYVILAEDFDALITARDKMQGGSPERSLLQTLLNEIEGVASSNHGNVAILSTTNRPLDLDPASAGRLRQKEFVVTGPTKADEYGKLLEIMLRDGVKYGYVQTDKGNKIARQTWTSIGKLCLNPEDPEDISNSLSGRDVRNVALRLYDVAREHMPTNTQDLRDMSDEEFKEMYSELMETIVPDMIREGVQEEYAMREADQESAEQEEYLKRVAQYELAAKARGDPKVIAAESNIDNLPLEAIEYLIEQLDKTAQEKKADQQ